MNERDPTSTQVSRPDHYSDEEWRAYKAGAAAAATYFANMTVSVAEAMQSQTAGEDAPEPADADEDEGGDDEGYDTKCECGRDLVYEVGSSDGYCPRCDT